VTLNQSDGEDSRHFVSAIKRIGVRPACVVREKQDVKIALKQSAAAVQSSLPYPTWQELDKNLARGPLRPSM
jgi:hypothetical protein